MSPFVAHQAIWRTRTVASRMLDGSCNPASAEHRSQIAEFETIDYDVHTRSQSPFGQALQPPSAGRNTPCRPEKFPCPHPRPLGHKESTEFRGLRTTHSCIVGSLSAHFTGILNPDVMDSRHAVEVLGLAHIGGRSSIWGGLTASLILVPAPEYNTQRH